MVSVFVIIGPLFFLTEPQFLCQNSDGEYEICNEKQGCDNGILDPNQRQTMSLSFGLYCKYKNFRGYESAATFFGSIFGNFIIAYLAEVQGRKTALLYSWGIATIGFIGIIFSFDKYSLMLCNFITGFGIQ
ncbi:Major facilitator superfamily domain, general substrate transporter [Pseudocohnilembus persalinus]|uniref:Major facilitator superfamily domain, general substrate transporter n=1 Tax=Pseudocohnilembus persalinus TaxID=266149 RepID=A0A0V0QUN4_PSEPJ|nr:Major facilitator superfamily domain, general substrate transporter [Pseudocohnilembus persalinus]|eukprot:KRX05821.1 Major facilitator superfamily domain, general substrate transporter [Pseudocohnilembus persalinus]